MSGKVTTTYAWSNHGTVLHLLSEVHQSTRQGVWVTEYLCGEMTTKGKTATGSRNAPNGRAYRKCSRCWQQHERGERDG